MRFFLVILLYLIPIFVLAAPPTAPGNPAPPSSMTPIGPVPPTSPTPSPTPAPSSGPGFAIENFNFVPPVGDYSVTFLGNIFGLVDGVLHGTGSQIFGQIFGVFNAAVMALGGILIIYTTTVSTMNTAHEGQFLGQKWSSIWVPLRSVIGISLLVPKASGYCIMQIFVMWVILQGIGAADKVWNAALGYLNRGGVIVQAQIAPPSSSDPLQQTGMHDIEAGAYNILKAQVCMLVIEKALKEILSEAQTQASNKAGVCYEPAPGTLFNVFCSASIPDFIGSVNPVAFQEAMVDAAPPATPPTEFKLQMPNLQNSGQDGLFYSLNKVCGELRWNNVSTTGMTAVNSALSASDLTTIGLTRAIAVQQLYQDLSVIARAIVDNLPFFNSQAEQSSIAIPNLAVEQFGIPLADTGGPCLTAPCTSWGPDPSLTGAGASSPAIFTGTEFRQAIEDYNAVMMPTLRLQSDMASNTNTSADTAFIQQAESAGWIMAGSYFFDIVRLNASAMQANVSSDTDSGLQKTVGPVAIEHILTNLQNATTCSTAQCVCQSFDTSAGSELCTLASGQLDFLKSLAGAFNGSSPDIKNVTPPAVSLESSLTAPIRPTFTVQQGALSSTLYGLVENSLMMQLPDQPGQAPPVFVLKLNLQLQTSMLSLPSISFPCGKSTFFVGCIGNVLADIFYNTLAKSIYNAFIQIIVQVINSLLQLVLVLPLETLANVFITGVSTIEHPNVNPVVALANMGVMYINFATSLWLDIMFISLAASMIPWFGLAVYMLLAILAPILGTWLVIMTGIGFTTAYYVPFLPYMIFTFGTIAWLMAIVEAMVAAPIVALGVTSPEGDQAFGKAEPALMLLMNVFLRPAMMIIGYIAAIIISYVSVWVINAGFANAIVFIQGDPTGSTLNISTTSNYGSDLVNSVRPSITNPVTGHSYGPDGAAQKVSSADASAMHMNNGYPG